MKKKKLYLAGATIFLMITVIIIKIFDSNQKLVMGEKKQEGNFIEIYELVDGRKVYSGFEDIKYISKTKQEYSLSCALKSKKTSLNSILFRKNTRGDLNDGGSKVYDFYTSKNKFVNKDISIYECNDVSIDIWGKSSVETGIYIVDHDDYKYDTPCAYVSSKRQNENKLN